MVDNTGIQTAEGLLEIRFLPGEFVASIKKCRNCEIRLLFLPTDIIGDRWFTDDCIVRTGWRVNGRT